MSRTIMAKKKFNLKLDDEPVDEGNGGKKDISKINKGFMGDNTLESIEL